MRQLLYIIFALTFIGCIGNHQHTDNNNLTDTINPDRDVINEVKTIETEQGDYKILPIDESGSDPSLVAFINNLKKIVSNKDTSGLFKSLDTAIVVSYGGGVYGIKEFSKNWELNEPDKSELWKILNRILNMGGTWENDEKKYFCIPYAQSNKAFSKYKYDFDWYFTAVCTSPKVTVYKEPKTTSIELATLSYDIVEMDPDFMKADFTKIHTIDKKVQGYVKTSDLIYSVDQKLVIKKIDDNWKITAFAPFD
jgi:hypothetical protein